MVPKVFLLRIRNRLLNVDIGGKFDAINRFGRSCGIKAGDLLSKPTERVEYHKGSIDLVTQYDRWSEETICEVPQKSGISILVKNNVLKGNPSQLSSNSKCTLDHRPTDGTTNFSRWSSTLLYFHRIGSRRELVLVLFMIPQKGIDRAEKGKGTLNDKRVVVSLVTH